MAVPYPQIQQNEIILKNASGRGFYTEENGDLYIGRVFHMLLLDGYTLSPPTPKIYTVDVPGGNGVIDLTDFVNGDAVFNNRKQEFTFALIEESGREDLFELVKTQISGLLHGKAFDYQLTFDPEYIYHGRFTISAYEHKLYQNGMLGTFKISIDAEPYKYIRNTHVKQNAYAGTIFRITSGRMPCKPSVKTNYSETLVVDKSGSYYVPSGKHKLNNVIFNQGVNELFVCSYMPDYFKYYMLNGMTYKSIKSQPMYELIRPPIDDPKYGGGYFDHDYDVTVYWDHGDI